MPGPNNPAPAGTGLPSEVIWLHHFAWHVGSIAVAGMIALFVYVALQPGYRVVAGIATGMSLGFALLETWSESAFRR